MGIGASHGAAGDTRGQIVAQARKCACVFGFDLLLIGKGSESAHRFGSKKQRRTRGIFHNFSKARFE